MARRAVAALVGAAVMLSACGGASQPTIRVSAASSLSDAFGALETAFERSNPGVDVVINLGGSSLLREQILAGAPVDVFASASTEIMDQVVEGGLVSGSALVFAENRIEIAVPLGNPAGVRDITDFGRADLFLGLCEERVPCGVLARSSLRAANVDPAPDTNEPNVKSLLTKIEAGELDAGIVYRTDVLAGAVEGIEIHPDYAMPAEYPIAVLADSSQQALADDFIEFVLSPAGQATLSTYGFLIP